MLKKLLLALAIATLFASVAHAAPFKAPHAASAPPVLKNLMKQGLNVDTHFSTPGEMTGYIGSLPDGKQVVFFIPEDGSVVIFGAMFDARGHNLSKAYLSNYQRGPLAAQTYKNLEKAHWIAAGSKHPKRIVYAFIDPDCPYCWQLWKKAKKHYGQGVQMRYIIVAILGKSSLHKAAAILAANDPHKALVKNESGFSHHSGAIKPMKDIPKALRDRIIEHNSLMQHFGFNGTPAIVWKDGNGAVKTSNGLPPASLRKKIFGPAD
jgi:thiol:disulfide interchange protein DsbG